MAIWFVFIVAPMFAYMSRTLSDGDAGTLSNFRDLENGFGLVTVILWGAYAVYTFVTTPLEMVLVEEDLREMMTRFSVETLEDAQEVLGLPRKELLQQLASSKIEVSGESARACSYY